MNNININGKVCKFTNTSLGEALLLLIVQNNVPISILQQSLINKGLVTAFNSKTKEEHPLSLSPTGIELLNSITTVTEEEDTPKVTSDDSPLLNLAKELKALFPKGKKQGTNLPWTDSAILIEKRLLGFCKVFNRKKICPEDIIYITKKYIESFEEDYSYMRILRYFIYKNERVGDGTIDYRSDLLNMLEKYEEDPQAFEGEYIEEYKSNWTGELV